MIDEWDEVTVSCYLNVLSLGVEGWEEQLLPDKEAIQWLQDVNVKRTAKPIGVFVRRKEDFATQRVMQKKHGWLVACFGFNGPLRQYFSLYRAISQREGEREEKG